MSFLTPVIGVVQYCTNNKKGSGGLWRGIPWRRQRDERAHRL